MELSGLSRVYLLWLTLNIAMLSSLVVAETDPHHQEETLAIDPEELPQQQAKYGSSSERECDMISHVQSAVIQILNNHYEYGKGIHRLHSAVDSVQNDVVSLKSKVTQVEKWQNAVEHPDKANQIPLGKVNDRSPYADPGTNDYIKHIQGALSKNILSGKTRHRHADTQKEIASIQEGLGNLTSLVQSQNDRISSLEKKYKGLRRSVKRTLDHILTTAMKEPSEEEKEDPEEVVNEDLMDHLVRKQKEINAHLEKRILELETEVKDRQADTPDTDTHTQACLPEYIRHLSSCYRFMNETANWVDAEKRCQGLHPRSHLVAIETKEEELFLIHYRLHNNVRWTSHYLWTGANDMTHEGTWTWVGTGGQLKYHHWRKGQPNNHNGEQHCMYFHADSLTDHHWDDWHCHSARLNFVCEIRL